jgi:DNA-binding response OmpR family regulator
MGTMTEATRSVLVVGVGDDTYEEILEALGSRYFFAERVDTTAEALQLAASLPYDAVILTCPLSDAELSDTIRSLRKPTSESHTAAIALLALTGELDSARERG